MSTSTKTILVFTLLWLMATLVCNAADGIMITQEDAKIVQADLGVAPSINSYNTVWGTMGKVLSWNYNVLNQDNIACNITKALLWTISLPIYLVILWNIGYLLFSSVARLL